jgi:hypothetical protein
LSEVEWRKSSYSAQGNCVEVGFLSGSGQVAIRDSKDRGGPVLVVSEADWHAFLQCVKDGIRPDDPA